MGSWGTDGKLGESWKNTNILNIGLRWTPIDNSGTTNPLTYEEAYAIDSKIDDGKPDTGICIACDISNWISCLKFSADDGTRNTRMHFKLDF